MEARHYPTGLYERIGDSYFYVGPPLAERKKSVWPMICTMMLILVMLTADVLIFVVAK